MILKTVGDLRSLIQDYPDEMELDCSLGADVMDLMQSNAIVIDESTYEFDGVFEIRCDEVPRFYFTIEVQEEEPWE